MDGVEDGTRDEILSITKNSCRTLIKYLKVSSENDLSILLNRFGICLINFLCLLLEVELFNGKETYG